MQDLSVMMCELPALLVLGEGEGRMVDCGDKHPAGMVWVLSSQVIGRVAAESPFWAEGGAGNLFLIFSLTPTHLTVGKGHKVTVFPTETAVRR